MDKLIAKIAASWNDCRALLENVTSDEVMDMAARPAIEDARGRLEREELGMTELSTSTSRGKVSSVYAADGWTGIVIKDYGLSEDVVLSPCPALIVPLDRSTVVELDVFRVREGGFSRSRIADGAVEWLGRETVVFGSAWATPCEGIAANISGIAGESLFLLVNGPPYAPYAHALDGGLAHRSSSFSSDLYNGRVFLGDLIKQAVAGRVQDHWERQEADRIKTFIREAAASADGVAEEIWPLTQSMAVLDRSAAVEILTGLAASDHELAPIARTTLLANGVHVHAGENRARI